MDQRASLFGFPEQRSWRKLLPYALLLGVTLALYASTLYFHFAWDDTVYIIQNYRIHGLALPQLKAVWTQTYLGHYAPIHHTFLALVHRVSAENPFGYHLAQLVVHAISVCLLYSILAKIESRRIALLASLLFAVHPTNIETVAWVSESKSTLAFLFFLLSFRSFLQWRRAERQRDPALCAVFLVISLLAKINTVVAPAVFALYEYWQSGLQFPRKRLLGIAGLAFISGLFVIVHLASFHGSASVAENAYYGGLAVHLLNLPFLVFFYLRMVGVPYPLSAWHMFRVYDRVTWEVVIAWFALAGLLWLLTRRASRRTQFWSLWFLVFLLPVLQIVPFPIWVAERYLYIPAIGLFVLASGVVVQVADSLSRQWQRATWHVLLAAVLIAFAWMTRHHLPVWRDDLHLWEATISTCPSSPYCHLNLGLSLLQAGQIERGVKELIRAVELRPSPLYLIALGDAYTLSLRDYRQALIAYKLALDSRSSALHADFYAKLARLFIRMDKLDEAERAIETGRKLDPNDPAILVVKGFLEWKRGNLQAARNDLGRVMAITGQTSPAGATRLLQHYWGNSAAVGRLIADLRAARGNAQPTTR
ncbi:MAG: tetratricopeptide repeat protein [Acidobacteria bacterium]|nr:tetratricopeptide repeat protein [Acidobacteriota bacterium]